MRTVAGSVRRRPERISLRRRLILLASRAWSSLEMSEKKTMTRLAHASLRRLPRIETTFELLEVTAREGCGSLRS
jgi:hypothetical protein